VMGGVLRSGFYIRAVLRADFVISSNCLLRLLDFSINLSSGVLCYDAIRFGKVGPGFAAFFLKKGQFASYACLVTLCHFAVAVC
jgi:hypothetical protein